MRVTRRAILAIGLSLNGFTSAIAVDYEKDVKPLLLKQCAGCHGPVKPKGGLRLDTASRALKGGHAGPALTPGSADESLLIDAVKGEGGIERMPLNRPALSAEQIKLLEDWINAGAKAPEQETTDPSAIPKHWAFVAPIRADLPRVRLERWVRNPVDRFILKKLESAGVEPSPEADRITLIRRVYFDLVGLPPSPEEVDAYLLDSRTDAYERVVDRLLQSPHFGERRARIWLDMARYADSNGYSIDAPRSIWKYRDWVINAYNNDKPFDQFTIEQLAGDLLPNATLDDLVATGFHRNTPINQEGGIDVEQFRVDSVIDRVNTTGTVFLGLTIGCAQCHDHKYDPISQKDYYGLFAFLNTVEEPEIPVALPEVVKRREDIEEEITSYFKQLWKNQPSLIDKQLAWEKTLKLEQRNNQVEEVRQAFNVPLEKRTEPQKRAMFAAYLSQEPTNKPLNAAVIEIRKKAPKIDTSMVVRELKQPRVTNLMIQGDFTRKGERVDANVPAVLPPLKAGAKPTRLELAKWLVSPSNPLTARVAVNRMWQELFGKGIVETENDFGFQGGFPSHPELLDWLATEFVRQGWKQKELFRLLVTSATYRQSSNRRPELDAVDRDNKLYAKQARLRLDAELVRDVALTASGLLNPSVGGPSVFPPQPAGVMDLGQNRRAWVASNGPDRFRRGLYTYLWRATPHPLLTVFDAPEATRACTRRLRSNTPLQALTLLNDQAFVEFAEALSSRVEKEGGSDEARIDRAFRLCLGRLPGSNERAALIRLLEEERRESSTRDGGLVSITRVLLNLDEFITRE